MTFTANVFSSSGIPTGTVQFLDGSTSLGIATLNGSGQAILSTNNLATGTHTITATYQGSASFSSSSGFTTQTVGSATNNATTTTVSGSPNPSSLGQVVTITAFVSSAAGTPTGSVLFTSNSTVLGLATLNGGSASITTSTLPLGNSTIVASYQGAPGFASSIGSTTQTVTNGTATATTTSVLGVPNPASVGQLVTFTATVISAAGTPTGTVQFLDGSTNLGVGTLNGLGQASISTSTLAAGTHSISATYSGSPTFGASTGFTTETIGQSTTTATTTTVSATPNPSALGQAVALTATVRSVAGTPATGSVTFVDGTTNLGTATLNGLGVATISVSTLPAGTQTITAFYSGAPLFGASSGSVTVTVNGGVVPGNPNETWVNQLYRDLLGRNGDPGGISFWAQKVNAGVSRTAVALQFEQTPESMAALINSVYEGTLHRAVDSVGLSGAEALLAQNGSVQNLQATLQGSAEYFQVRAGLNQLFFLNSLYTDALGSLPTPLVVSQLLPLLNSGYPHLALAQVVEASAAADAHYVTSLFNQYLGRGVDAAGLQFDVDFLQQGGRDDQLIANILGSDEYFQRAQAGL